MSGYVSMMCITNRLHVNSALTKRKGVLPFVLSLMVYPRTSSRCLDERQPEGIDHRIVEPYPWIFPSALRVRQAQNASVLNTQRARRLLCAPLGISPLESFISLASSAVQDNICVDVHLDGSCCSGVSRATRMVRPLCR